MKIISWNINGLRALDRKGALEEIIDSHQPDFLCLQETKIQPPHNEVFIKKYPQYQQHYVPSLKAGYAGVSIWYKKNIPLKNIQFCDNFAGNPVPEEGRLAQLDFVYYEQSWSLLGVYFPNGGKSPEAYQDKLKFYQQFAKYVDQLRSQGKKVVWTGDVNCAHQPIDLARPKENTNSIGFLPAERAWIDQLITDDWVDVFRQQNPDKITYSWWHVLSGARARNVGWRIDYFFLDKNMLSSLVHIGYLTKQLGSDHCPVILELKNP